MVKEKATITLDRVAAAEAQRITGAPSVSAAIDVALRELIRLAHLRSDIAAYSSTPVSPEEVALAAARPHWSDLADDTDWEVEFPIAQR